VHADQQKIKDKKLRGKVQKLQNRFGEVAYNAARSEMLLPTDRGFLEVEGMEKTYKVKQDQLLKQVDITTAQKVSMIFFVLTKGIRAPTS
jgi:U3 small nucleolar RNA-associated protein 7